MNLEQIHPQPRRRISSSVNDHPHLPLLPFAPQGWRPPALSPQAWWPPAVCDCVCVCVCVCVCMCVKAASESSLISKVKPVAPG